MNPGAGVSSFVEGFSLARHPGLRRYTWLPVAISLIVCVTGLYFAFDYLIGVTNRFIAGLPEWLSWLDLILTPLLYISGVLGGTWLFGLLAVLIASPFLGAFSMALERIRFGDAPAVNSQIWTDISMSLVREGRKILYHLPRLLLVFLLTLIPVINLAAPAIWLLFGAWTMAVQFVDYPTENRQQPFQQTLDKLKANRTAALAFGLCATGALMIPLLNFLLIPVAVAGGTILWRKLEQGPADANAQP
jgi:CysZ protein